MHDEPAVLHTCYFLGLQLHLGIGDELFRAFRPSTCDGETYLLALAQAMLGLNCSRFFTMRPEAE